MSVSAHYFSLPIINAYGANPVNFLSDTIKVLLTTSSYTPNQDTNAFKSDVTNEVTGTGYSAGGMTLASKTLTYNSGTKTITFDAADVSWTSSTITARTAVVYDGTPGSDATRPLFVYDQSSTDVVSTGGTWAIVWDVTGIATIQVS